MNTKPKYVELSKVRVYHNPKTNTIELISKDKELAGKAFRLVLNKGTESENTLRELLESKGVLEAANLAVGEDIPKFINYPLGERERERYGMQENPWHYVPLGVTHDKELVTVDVKEFAHTYISGRAGTGKTVLQRSFLLHALEHPKYWDIYAIDPSEKDMAFLANHRANVKKVAHTLDEAEAVLAELIGVVNVRKTLKFNAKVSTIEEYEEKEDVLLPAVMVAVNNILELVHPTISDDEETIRRKKWVGDTLYEIMGGGVSLKIFFVVTGQENHRKLFGHYFAGRFIREIIAQPEAFNPDGTVAASFSRTVVEEDNDLTEEKLKVASQSRGRALLDNDGEYTAFQIFYTSPNLFEEFPV